MRSTLILICAALSAVGGCASAPAPVEARAPLAQEVAPSPAGSHALSHSLAVGESTRVPYRAVARYTLSAPELLDVSVDRETLHVVGVLPGTCSMQVTHLDGTSETRVFRVEGADWRSEGSDETVELRVGEMLKRGAPQRIVAIRSEKPLRALYSRQGRELRIIADRPGTGRVLAIAADGSRTIVTYVAKDDDGDAPPLLGNR